MIEFKKVSKEFYQKDNQIIALDNVSLTIRKNEFFGLVGASGSGKSTLLRLINGLENPTKGQILIAEQSVGGISTKEKRKIIQKIGMVFQQFNLLQNMTVQKNIELSLKIQGKKNFNIINDMLDFVGMSDHKDKYPSQLSGGQKQRVAIARALATQPKILLCDEPTSALDEHNGEDVMALLKQTQKEFETTIVFVSHELELIKRWCDRAAIMENGHLLSVVDVANEEVVVRDESYYEKALRYLS